MRRVGFLFTALVLFLFTDLRASAQGGSTIGVPPNAARISIPLGFVDALTGQVHLEIPIESIPERNGTPLTVFARYDTTYYTLNTGTYLAQNSNGWTAGQELPNSGVLTTAIHYNIQNCPANYPHGSVTKYDNFRFTDILGAHSFPSTAAQFHYFCYYDDSAGHAHYFTPADQYFYGSVFSTDGQGYFFDQRYVWNKSGILFVQSTPSVDTNGNTGGQFVQSPVTKSPAFPGACNSSASFSMSTTVSDGTTQTYTFNCRAYSVAQGTAAPGTVYMMSSIALPDGTQYTFTYDEGRSGVLTGVTLPTGGQISFSYVIDNFYRPQLASVTVGGGTWDFTGQNIIIQDIGATTSVLGPARFDPATSTYIRDNTVYTPTPSSAVRFPQTIQYYSGSSTLLKTESMTYGGYCLTSKTTTLNDTGQTSKVSFTYGSISCSLPTQKQEWDYGASVPTRTTKVTYIQDTNTIHYNSQYHIYDRPLSISLYAGDGTTGSPVQSITFAYDEYSANYCTVPMLSGVTGATNHDDTNHGATFWARGNPTSVTKAGTGASSVTTHTCYDTLGNVTQTVDGMGNKTTFDYSENWADSYCIPSGNVTRAFPTTITDALGHRTQSQYYSCTALNSVIKDENDIRAARNGTTFTYDFMNRPLTINHVSGASQSYAYSDSPSGFSSTLTKAISSGIGSFTKVASRDSFGRENQTSISSDPSGPSYTFVTYDALGNKASIYNPTRCNPPTTSCGESTWGYTTYYYDALGRTILQVPPDGTLTANNISTTYAGNCSIVRDQAGKSVKSCSDAFGRVIQVFQDPTGSNFETDYSYDVLNNLISISQKGNSPNSANWRTRTFTYDGLSRVVCASSPENSTAPCPATATGSYTPGTVGLTYDANGNILARTAPAPNQTGSATVTTTNTYDALNRITQKVFSDGTTATVKYGYDGNAPPGCTLPALTVNNGVGKRTGMCDAAGAEAWSYDLVAGAGWKTTDARLTNGITKSTVLQNNLADSPSTITYPSGRTITYAYDTAMRPISVVDNSVPLNYATNGLHAPSGALTKVQNGGSLYSTTLFNSRLEPCWQYSSTSSTGAPTTCGQGGVTLGTILDFQYDFNFGAANNGDVGLVTNRRDPTRSQNFTYDSLNRLATAQTQTVGVTIPNSNCWGLTFAYDPWGNLLTSSITGPAGCSEPMPINLSVASSNRIISSTLAGQVSNYCYDAAGDLVYITSSGASCPASGPYQYVYDAESHLIAAGNLTYLYDGDGKRVQKSNNKLYWYGLSSEPLEETDAAGNTNNSSFFEYIFFAGSRVARRDSSNNVDYYYSDYLGTAHVITNGGGTVLDDSDYYPFGAERSILSSSGNPYKFTGKELDPESSFYDFGVRFYSPTIARFISPDQGAFSLANPDSLNRYTYGLDNPLFYLDPDGDTSISGVWRLGTVLVNTWVQEGGAGSTFDLSAILSSLAGPKVIALKDQQQSSSIIQGGQAQYTRSMPAPNPNGGGCVLGCTAMFDQVPNAAAITLSFDYDEKTNVITKTNITYSIDTEATFIGPEWRHSEPGRQPYPGWTPPPDITKVSINASVLKNLTSDQLNALFTATNGQNDPVSKAIADAVLTEKKRRGTEAEKKAKEEERKKCAELHSSCRATSTTDSSPNQRP